MGEAEPAQRITAIPARPGAITRRYRFSPNALLLAIVFAIFIIYREKLIGEDCFLSNNDTEAADQRTAKSPRPASPGMHIQGEIA
ncbi:hypothetical protein WJ972_32140 [Achromobacter insuavis]